MKKHKKKFWIALVLFGLVGQVAWVVENMYLNVFIYKMFHASAADISFMVSASAVTATLTVVLCMIFSMMRNGHYDLLTEAAEQDKHLDGWDQYPRPQMKREKYQLLNTGWKLNGHFIRVPFPPQSVLADYPYKVGEQLTYETIFHVPDTFTEERILLHFGAVDQHAEVWINEKLVGKHEGGYLAFGFDITEFIEKNSENQLVVKVTDRLDKTYPYGKQCKKRGGMWYTPISGIWQNVWMENVPAAYIQKVVLTPDLEGVHICLVSEKEIRGFTVTVTLENGTFLKAQFEGSEGRISLADQNPRLWTMEDPYLYTTKIETESDMVETYFGLRTIDIREIDGVKRVCLNEKPVFMHGVLDQGYYSDGIYLPAEPQEYERDIFRMKELGINLLRKHIKVE